MNVLVCLRVTTRASSEPLDQADLQALAHGIALRAAGHSLTAIYAATQAEAPAVAALLASHVDRAVRVSSDELLAADFHTIGQMLATAIRRMGADVVLAPVQGEDDAANGAPAAIARYMNARYVPFVEEIPRLESAGAEALVRGGGRTRRLRIALPAVLAVSPGNATLPAPTAPPAAAPPQVETLALSDPEATLVRRRTELLGRPEPASRGTQTVSSAAELIAALKRR